MKRILLSAVALAVIATNGFSATDSKTKDLSLDSLNNTFIANYNTSKDMMDKIKISNPLVYEVINDYFKAKTCSEDITSSVSVKEIKDFAASVQYGLLIGFKSYSDTPVMKANYINLTSSYKVMNCGDLDALKDLSTANSIITEAVRNKSK